MDSLIAASARALAAGDALGALKRVALRDDPPALALRGIAMAQLGEHPRARALLRQAARGFVSNEAVSRARCVVAEAEVAMAMRDFSGSPKTLAAAADLLVEKGDCGNALQARLVAARQLLLIGRLGPAAAALALLQGQAMAPALAAVAELTSAELALRSLQIGPATAALARAQQAAEHARIPALANEVAEVQSLLQRPAARRIGHGRDEALRLSDAAALLAGDALVVDGCRRGIAAGGRWMPLARRPVLFALARQLAEAWPADADRDALIADTFRLREPDETHRARLRVEIGRLRALLKPVARIEATPRGFTLRPLDNNREVAVLVPPIAGDSGALLALLSDGAAWSTSALSLALDASQRTVQRELAALEAAGRVRSVGKARAQRWLAPPLAGFTTILLLPAALPFA